jgi:hypothetical protein
MVTHNTAFGASPNPITTAIATPAHTTHTEYRNLNMAWRQYFAQTTPAEIRPPIVDNNLNLDNNSPWGPDVHDFLNEDCFRIVWQSQNNSLPSWAATMDFLHGLQTSLFCFTEPNLQWDKTLLANAKDLQ